MDPPDRDISRLRYGWFPSLCGPRGELSTRGEPEFGQRVLHVQCRGSPCYHQCLPYLTACEPPCDKLGNLPLTRGQRTGLALDTRAATGRPVDTFPSNRA